MKSYFNNVTISPFSGQVIHNVRLLLKAMVKYGHSHLGVWAEGRITGDYLFRYYLAANNSALDI